MVIYKIKILHEYEYNLTFYYALSMISGYYDVGYSESIILFDDEYAFNKAKETLEYNGIEIETDSNLHYSQYYDY